MNEGLNKHFKVFKDIFIDGIKEYQRTKNTLDLDLIHDVMVKTNHGWWTGESLDNAKVPSKEKISARIDDLFMTCMKNLIAENNMSDICVEHKHYAECGGFTVSLNYYPRKGKNENSHFYIEIKYSITSK